MDTSVTAEPQVNIEQLAHQVGLSADSVRNVVELLDDENTVPFITRYRRDQTGGLDEQAILRIKEAAERQRQLYQRKETILKSIKSQDRLTEGLEKRIREADSAKLLEDLYLPFKPKKRTLATLARERGLGPLADEVLRADPATTDLEQRAAGFVDPDKQLNSTADVLAGVRHVLAERFSERAEIRGKLRAILRRSGRICSKRFVAPESAEGESPVAENAPPATTEQSPTADATASRADDGTDTIPSTDPSSDSVARPAAAAEPDSSTQSVPQHDEGASSDSEPSVSDDSSPAVSESSHELPAEESPTGDQSGDHAALSAEPTNISSDSTVDSSPNQQSDSSADQPQNSEPLVADASDETTPVGPTAATASASENATSSEQAPSTQSAPARARQPTLSKADLAEKRRQQRKEARQRKRRKLEQAFKDYFEYEESLSRIPHHRVLAINRGERARILRVKIDADVDSMHRDAEQILVPTDHPHAALLRDCVRDALTRLLLPSLEREVRRELSQQAEDHAISVFARNLRKLLLQPPVHGRRVLALDPGFRNGCRLTALDSFGNVLDQGVVYVIGKDERRKEARDRLAEMIRKHQLSVVAIGNGSGCRESELLVAEVIAEQVADFDVSYVVVNEAGASVYSTSDIGREELPNYDATVRGAVSIGRRLLDPLSELVKINPSNIGVGLYQHDVKSKPLQAALDAVVHSCVNYVGVDVNTASPSLLSYVSGLNQLTARRLYEHRCEHGPFASRNQLKQVPGIGETTFIQAAGFLKITDGENPLDATWIHPESYEVAERVLRNIDSDLSELAARLPQHPKRPAPVETPSGGASGVTTAPESATAEVVATQSANPPAPTDAPTNAPSQVGDETTSVKPNQQECVTEEPMTNESVVAAPALNLTAEEEPATRPPIAEAPTKDQPVTEGLASQGPVAEQSGAETQSGAMTIEASDKCEVAPELHETVALADETKPATAAATETSSAGDVVGEPAADTTDSSPSGPGDAPTEMPSPDHGSANLAERMRKVDVDSLSGELGIGRLLLRDIVSALARPGRDPRDDLPPPVFRRGILKLEDLEPEMELSGTVVNVVDFGAFVDIGLTDTGLVHISRLADRYVRDPHEVVSVGDVMSLWVVSVEKDRRRVSLTAIKPGLEKPHKPRRDGGGKKTQAKEDRGSGSRRSHQRTAKSGTPGGRPQRKRARFSRPPAKPKPVVPITKEMEDGKEPMRTFSDLKQFYQKKEQPKSNEEEETPES